MPVQALYRKWRSQAFDEIVAQEHVTRTLRNALRDGRVAHAYLFAGPRGTGKTSMARLLAKAVNCVGDTDEKPCNRCHICTAITEGRSLDLIEIDAASNRGIDEVRDLREKVGFRPNECRYRVYILDEAHMLTNAAFNALLKTLEEPPPHVIFVLVTTEPHNIPMTILSRCQRFDFRRIPLPDIVGHLRKVALEEGLRITEAALEVIARHATGSLRDALSLLDQLMAYQQDEITLERVHDVLGTAPLESVNDLVRCLAEGDLTAGLRVVNEALDRGVEPRQLNKDLLEYLRGVLLLKVSGDAGLLNVTVETLGFMQQFTQQMPLGKLLAAIRAFNQAGLDLKDATHPRLPLEMALVDALTAESGRLYLTPSMSKEGPPVVQSPVPTSDTAGTSPADKGKAETVRKARDQEVTTEKMVPSSRPAEPTRPAPTLEWFQENWRTILAAVRSRNRSVEALLNKSCEPREVQGNMLVLAFYHGFHREKMEQSANKKVLEEALAEVVGVPFVVKCVRFEGDGQQRARLKEKEEAQERQNQAIESDPVVREAVDRYGAKIIDVRPLEV